MMTLMRWTTSGRSADVGSGRRRAARSPARAALGSPWESSAQRSGLGRTRTTRRIRPLTEHRCVDCHPLRPRSRQSTAVSPAAAAVASHWQHDHPHYSHIHQHHLPLATDEGEGPAERRRSDPELLH